MLLKSYFNCVQSNIQRWQSTLLFSTMSTLATEAFTKGYNDTLMKQSRQEDLIIINNSLVREEVPFIPVKDGKVSWYICGPTVYDVTHMGHARNYLTFDIIRRILQNHFKFEVEYVMNVTDIDDKIIFRARRNFLLDQYLQQHSDQHDQVLSDIVEALTRAVGKQEKKVKEQEEQLVGVSEQKQVELQKKVQEELKKLDTVQKNLTSVQMLAQNSTTGEDRLQAALKAGSDALAEKLDSEKGTSVTDHSIYEKHARKYEDEFFDDLAALGCLKPTRIEPIRSNVENITEYIQQIQRNGLAYESNGSVYFDTSSFRTCGHQYGGRRAMQAEE